MKTEIVKVLVRAIRAEKWANVSYSKDGGTVTRFWIAVSDIDFKEEDARLKCNIYNPDKNIDSASEVMGGGLYLSRIQSASVIDFTHYDVPISLYRKLDENMGKWDWLGYEPDISYLLNYYDECNKLDKDPYQREHLMIPGIDLATLMKDKELYLVSEQKKALVSIYGKYFERRNIHNITEFAISRVAIDKINGRSYVVCYNTVRFNPKKGTLSIDKSLRFNKSFLHKRLTDDKAKVDEGKSSLFQYAEMDLDEFIKRYNEDENWGQQQIYENLRNGDLINTRPEMMILEREIVTDLNSTYKAIIEREVEDKLNVPLRSFFGRMSGRYKRSKEPSIIICDEKINVDQTRVLYNAMKQPVTFVQGPPGTGKTQTILNVVLNGFYNEKTIMVCSSNNKPVDGIIEKLKIEYKGKVIPFPYIRLGNIGQVKKALYQIKELFDYTSDLEPDDQKINRIKNSTDNKNASLRDILVRQEKHVMLEGYLTDARQLLKEVGVSSKHLAKNLQKHVAELEKQANENLEVHNSEVLSLFTPLNEDKQLLQWMYFTSLKYIRNLQKPRYQDLKDICNMDNEGEMVKEFNKWLSDDANMKKFCEAFPIIFTTNISALRLGSPNFMFDLVIMDEAGQCNVAQSLIPITKASSLLLVGDPLQLKPIVVLEESTNKMLMRKYSIPEDYDYKHNSILDIMRNHDSISQYVLLKYHYRCGKNIIGFSNKKYYDSRLDLTSIKDTGELVWMNVKNVNVADKNEAYEEAKSVVDYLKRNGCSDTTIITPFVNQKELINRMLVDEGMDSKVSCDTVHAMQGGEKGTVILSTALSPRTSQRTFEWLKNNTELLNVGITRAQKKLVVACDDDVLKSLANEEKSDLVDLVNYVKSNGKADVTLNEAVKVELGKSNNSYYEKEFFKTISQFCSVNSTFEVKRNVPFSVIFADDKELKNLNYEFDCVLYDKKWFKTVPRIAIEINGGEHCGNKTKEKADMRKKEVCEKKGIVLLMISNSFVKSYEQLRTLIINSKGVYDSQTSMFNYM